MAEPVKRGVREGQLGQKLRMMDTQRGFRKAGGRPVPSLSSAGRPSGRSGRAGWISPRRRPFRHCRAPGRGRSPRRPFHFWAGFHSRFGAGGAPLEGLEDVVVEVAAVIVGDLAVADGGDHIGQRPLQPRRGARGWRSPCPRSPPSTGPGRAAAPRRGSSSSRRGPLARRKESGSSPVGRKAKRSE